MTVEELHTLHKHQTDFLLIDIREPYEFEEYNLGGTLIPMGDLLDRVEEIADWKDKTVVLHCQSGKRSSAACHVLQGLGFTHVCTLEGGADAWKLMFG